MVYDGSFLDLMARLRAGDERAAAEVCRRFTGRLIALARSQFDTWLSHKVEAEDIVQSVFGSFFNRCGQGQFDLDGWNSLWALLTVITVRKSVNRLEYLRAGCRDARREVGAPPGQLDPASDGWAAVDREPTPLEAAMLTETLEERMRDLDLPERQIIEMTLQGYTVPEIRAHLGRAERTVRRVRERIKRRLLRMHGEDTGQV